MHNKETTPPRPKEPPADGYTWTYEPGKGWYEVEIEIRTSKQKPFFNEETKPLDLPEDAGKRKPGNPN